MRIITVASDNTIKIWRTTDGLLLSTLIDSSIAYRSVSLLPGNTQALLVTNLGYQILDYQKKQIVASKMIANFVGGGLLKNTSILYYAKGIEGQPGAKATFKIHKRDVVAGSDDVIAEFEDPQSRVIIGGLGFSFNSDKTLMIYGPSKMAHFLNTKDNLLKRFDEYKYIDKTDNGIIDYSYDISSQNKLLEISHYREKNDYTVRFLDISSLNEVKKKEYKSVSSIRADENGILILYDDKAALYDENSDKTSLVKIPAGNIIVSYDKKNNNFILADSKTKLDVSMLDAASGNIIVQLGDKTIYNPYYLANDEHYQKFWLSSKLQRKFLNIESGQIQITSANALTYPRKNFIDFNKKSIFEKAGDSIFNYSLSEKGIKQSGPINILNLMQQEFPEKRPYAFCMSSDRTLAAFGRTNKIIIYDLLQKKVVNTFDINASINEMNFSTDNKFFFYSGSLEETTDDSRARLFCFKTSGTRSLLWEKINWNVEKMEVFSDEPDKLYVLNKPGFNEFNNRQQGNAGFYVIKAATGEVLQNYASPVYYTAEQARILKATKTAMYAADNYIFSVNKTVNRRLTDRYAGAGFEPGYSYFYNEEFLIFPLSSGAHAIYDIKNSIVIAELYLFEKSDDWLLLTRDGRFDGTQTATKSLYYIKGENKIEIDAVYEKFYTPNLLMRLLKRENLPPVDVDLDNLLPKPKAKIFYAEKKRNLEVENGIPAYTNTSGTAEITVNATAPEDKVDEIRLFHNGKAVNLATRGLFVTDADGTDTKKYTINLLPGNNNFRAIALNSQRTESEPDEINVTYKKDGSAPEPVKPDSKGNVAVDEIDRNATLHIVVVGINAYKNKINPLTYALPDATAFKTELEKDAKSMVNNVKSYLITDDAASKAGIVSAFDNIKKSAKPEDVFVFYYAGHGYIHPSNKEFYLVSSDVADGDESLLKNGVSAKELQTFAVDIPAQKQLFIMDACQSAGAFEKMLQHDGEQQKALAVVSRSTGTHWMAASGSTETAKEFGELGHGVFTYSLLEALKGKAVNNKMITVNGLKNYLQTIVPELVKKYGGNSQYPASYGFGNDFPVEIVK